FPYTTLFRSDLCGVDQVAMVAIHSRASPLFSMVLRAARKVADFDLHVRTVYMTTDAGAGLITVSELAKLIDTDDKPVLLDVRWQVGLPALHSEYLAGHLPDAQWCDLDADLADPPGAGGRHP